MPKWTGPRCVCGTALGERSRPLDGRGDAVNEQEKKDMAALKRALKHWGKYAWNTEAIALGWFLCLRYRSDRARQLAEEVE